VVFDGAHATGGLATGMHDDAGTRGRGGQQAEIWHATVFVSRSVEMIKMGGKGGRQASQGTTRAQG